jgi:hypothetical protein
LRRHPLTGEFPVHHAAQILAETQILGTLCGQTGADEQRKELAQILEHYVFLEAEHQIVFGSIRSLLFRDRLANTSLAVHLNNRGFPDVDLDKYRAAGLPSIDEALRLARRLVSIAQRSGDDARHNSQEKSSI